jgi:hypothetical protein
MRLHRVRRAWRLPGDRRQQRFVTRLHQNLKPLFL